MYYLKMQIDPDLSLVLFFLLEVPFYYDLR